MEIKEIAEQLVNLTVKEVNELAKILKDEYGIEPAAAAPVRHRRNVHPAQPRQSLRRRVRAERKEGRTDRLCRHHVRVRRGAARAVHDCTGRLDL